MVEWLRVQLIDKYRRQHCSVEVIDSHAVTLDSVLQAKGVISDYPQTVGLDIQIDVLGIVKLERGSEIYFIEAKKKPLNLHDLGQLWAYCRLCNPSGAYLLSSAGLGSLDKILNLFHREDMLDFGDGRRIKKMIVGLWDVDRNTIDNHTVIPKI